MGIFILIIEYSDIKTATFSAFVDGVIKQFSFHLQDFILYSVFSLSYLVSTSLLANYIEHLKLIENSLPGDLITKFLISVVSTGKIKSDEINVHIENRFYVVSTG